MEILTGFGDSAVLLPLSAIIVIWLTRARSNVSALWWLAALAFAIGVTSLLKIYFLSCPSPTGLHSPSGHTSFSVVVYGGLAVIGAAERPQNWQKIAIWGSGAALSIGIGLSRIALGHHNPQEVEIGLLVGLVALTVFAIGYSRSYRRGGGLLILLVVIVGVAVLVHGRKLDFEDLFRLLGLRWHVRAHVCS